MGTQADDATGPRSWIGRSEIHADVVSPFADAALTATLDRTDPYPLLEGQALRPLRHWLYFLPLHRRSELGRDGHPERGGFLPPIVLPRRMWAGGRLRFEAPFRIGAHVQRVSTIAGVTEKTGHSGRLAFVLVRHEIFEGGRLLLTEEHDIVYRDIKSQPAAREPRPAPLRTATVTREFKADETLLFRYSALTFNAHRIHYDRRYVREEEGYPGLIVHGPLLATLLADLALDETPGYALSTFRFRAVAPVFDGRAVRLSGAREADGSMALWIAGEDGALAMEASATFVAVPGR